MDFKVRNIPVDQYAALRNEAEKTNTSINKQVLDAISSHVLALSPDIAYKDLPPATKFEYRGEKYIKSAQGSFAFHIQRATTAGIRPNELVRRLS